MKRRKYTTESLLPLLKSKNLKPLTPYPGNTNKPWKFECLICGKEVQKSLHNLKVSKSGCIYCSYKAQRKYTTESLLPLLKSKNLKPLTPYPGNTNKPWKCECLKCGAEVTPAVAALLKGQGGCYICGRSYKYSPAFVYLLHNKNLKTIKVGITNENAHRLKGYPGWEQVRLIPLRTGGDALQLENAILEIWRIKLKLPIKLNKRDLRHGGYTETADEIGLNEAIELIDNWRI